MSINWDTKIENMLISMKPRKYISALLNPFSDIKEIKKDPFF